MKKYVARIMFVAVLVILPVYLPWRWVEEGRQNAAQGVFIADVWLPKDCEVFTDADTFRDQFKKQGQLYLKLSPDKYRQELADAGQHSVWLTSFIAKYRTYQGKVLVDTEIGYDEYPTGVTITEFKYLGDGRVRWGVTRTTGDIVREITLGVLVGLLLDFLSLIIGFVALVIVSATLEGLGFGSLIDKIELYFGL